jgi:hypothetical protein
MAEVEHNADRPSWDCRACHDPWPCAPARARMLDEMSSIELAMFCWANLEEAAGDMPQMTAAEAFDRFMNWSRPRRLANP